MYAQVWVRTDKEVLLQVKCVRKSLKTYLENLNFQILLPVNADAFIGPKVWRPRTS